MKNVYTIDEVLKVVRNMYVTEQDKLRKNVYLELGLAIKALLERDVITYFDDFNDKETCDKIMRAVNFEKAKENTHQL